MSQHYNTTNECGTTLIDFEIKAKSLQETIYEIFKLTNEPLNWCAIKSMLPRENENSIRRSVTNLKTEGKVFKTTEKVIGIYGRPTYKYKLV